MISLLREAWVFYLCAPPGPTTLLWMQHNSLGTPPKETPSENKLGEDNLPVSWAVLTSPSMLWSAFTLAHLSTRSPSLTLRWMNPKKNKKWVQLHMSAMSQHVDEEVSARWTDIIQGSCICISVTAIRLCSPHSKDGDDGWLTAWGCFSSSDTGLCRSTLPALTRLTCRMNMYLYYTLQLAWLEALTQFSVPLHPPQTGKPIWAISKWNSWQLCSHLIFMAIYLL